MTKARLAIVTALEWLCTRLDHIPAIERDNGQWRYYRYGDWGCRLNICRRAVDLDDRWHTGYWYETE